MDGIPDETIIVSLRLIKMSPKYGQILNYRPLKLLCTNHRITIIMLRTTTLQYSFMG